MRKFEVDALGLGVSDADKDKNFNLMSDAAAECG